MFEERSLCEALVKLDRKLSRAASNHVGIKLTADELDLFASLGILSSVAKAKAQALEEMARERRPAGRGTAERE